mmetsp:Transcript_16280/g.29780  ORF Transcript_16280/g.29780 Transcript_16280/m.29780 type:complete len:231 (-) Transcript_16280:55-747(-)
MITGSAAALPLEPIPAQGNKPSMSDSNTHRDMKTVYLVRHAESLENEKLAGLKDFAKMEWRHLREALSLLVEPSIIDSPVSQTGKAQIELLCSRLQQAEFLKSQGIQLVLHSPLVRARDTCEGILASCTNKYRTVVEDSLREKYIREWIPVYGAMSLDARIEAFCETLGKLPEERILVVGHSQYFRRMLGMEKKFQNCDVWRVEFVRDQLHDKWRWESPTRVFHAQPDDE